jgi:signal transduction histidine kinase/putative methionine-R-sulfoxide reductase with GAF domain
MRILVINPDTEHALQVETELMGALQDHHVSMAHDLGELSGVMSREHFDVVLVDLSNGQQEGWISEVRRHAPNIPILAFLSEGQASTMPIGVMGYLPLAPGWKDELIKWLDQPGIRLAESLTREHQRLQKSTRLWATLSQVGRILSSTLEPDRVLELILEQAVEVLQAVGGSLILVDKGSNELVFELAVGPTATDLIGHRMPWGVGLVGEAAATGQPLLVNNTADDPRWFSGIDEATDFTTQSILCAPMITRQEVIGVLEIVNKLDGSLFDEDEAELLLALASQAAIAITNARLYVATRRQAEEVAALLETSQAISSTPDLEQRLETISQKAVELVDADGFIIFNLDQDNQSLVPIMAIGDSSEEVMRVTLPVGEGISGRVAATGEGRVVNQAHLSPDAFLIPDTPREPECILSVPLTVKGGVIGVMTLSRLGERAFSVHDLDLISSLGNQAAVAVENARLYDDTRQRNRELTALYSVALAAGKTLEMKRLLDETLDQVLKVLEYEGGAIFLVDQDNAELGLTHHQGVPGWLLQLIEDELGDTGAVGQAAADGQIVERALSVPEGRPRVRLTGVPLLAHRRVLGVLVVPFIGVESVEVQEIRLLQTLGRQIGVAVENAVLYAELQERAETLQRAYDELAKIDQLKDELVQNISHELRTPITFIKGYVSLMLEGDMGDLTPRQRSSLDIVSNKTEQLIHLVNGILTLQTLTAEMLNVESISPILLVSRAVAGAIPAAQGAGIAVVSDFPSEMPDIEVDPAQITQVLDNLLNNAIKFSPSGGTITVRLSTENDMVRVEVLDTGIGIPADKIDRVFDRFFQVDGSSTRRFGGAGLGLSICRQIIDAHGGELGVESEVGKGSTFAFTVPQAQSR